MKVLFAIALILLSGFAVAQSQSPVQQGPDCTQRFSFTTTGDSPVFQNYSNTTGQVCKYWVMTYSTVGTISVVSLVVQTAPAGANPTTPGTFVTFPGTAIQGSITNTSTSGATAFLDGGNNAVPFIKLHLTTFTHSGAATLYGVLQGWNAGNAGGAAAAATGGSGCVGTVATPCVVAGAVASGSPPTQAPLPIAGFDGTNLQPISTDTSGDTKTVGAQPANATATWAIGSALNSAVTISVVGYSNVAISCVKTGTVSNGVISFEISPDGTNWFALSVVGTTATGASITTYALSGASGAWQMYVGGFTQARVRLSTAITTGAGSATIFLAPSVGATEFAQVVGQATAANLQATIRGPAANGAAIVGAPVLTAGWDGTNVRTNLYCPNQAVISTSAAKTVIIALSGSLLTYICNIQLSNASGINIQLVSGTLTTTPCDTAAVNLTGTFQNWLSGGLNFQANAPLTAGAGLAVCLFQSGTVDIEGVVTYAQF